MTISDFTFYSEPAVITGSDENPTLFAGLGERDGKALVCIGIDAYDHASIRLDREETAQLVDTLMECLGAMDAS